MRVGLVLSIMFIVKVKSNQQIRCFCEIFEKVKK